MVFMYCHLWTVVIWWRHFCWCHYFTSFWLTKYESNLLNLTSVLYLTELFFVLVNYYVCYDCTLQLCCVCVCSICVLCWMPAETHLARWIHLDKVKVPRLVDRCSHDWPSCHFSAGLWRGLHHYIPKWIWTVNFNDQLFLCSLKRTVLHC